MQVKNAGNHLIQKTHHAQPPQATKDHHKLRPQEKTPDSGPHDTEQTRPVEEPDKDIAGVLRLLAEDHFKGVANLRLRINFHEELETIRTREVTGLLQKKTATIVEQLQEKIQDIPVDESVEAGDVLADFQTAVSNLFVPDENTRTPRMIIAGLEDAFGQLVESLQPVSDPTKTALTELQSWFTNQISDLKTELNDHRPPPLSGPNGKGRAYNRFLAMYNEMMQTDKVDDPKDTEIPSAIIDSIV